jgi:hypothetical protein
MSYLKNFRILRILLLITSLMMFTTNSFSWWWCNNSDSAYGGDGGECLNTSTSLIDQYIVEGAGYFLDSYSYTLQFMRKVELAGSRELNYPDLNQLLDSALLSMQNARDTYKLLKETADITPYNPVVIEALNNFDYDRYCEENGLNDEIFNRVKSYLVKGQVTGIYGKLLADMETMIVLMRSIKINIDNNLFPPVKAVRKLNQTYSTSLLFGQYVAAVFADLNI